MRPRGRTSPSRRAHVKKVAMQKLRRRDAERGAILIQVAIAMLGLIAFTAFVVDYGVMWVARSEAQTAADAGALAGSRALAFGGTVARATDAAQKTAMAHRVFGQLVPA